jgi:hypothetical protein
MGTIRIVAEFLQQQLNNNTFGYEIYDNGALVSKVDKTFKSEINEYVGRIVNLDNTNNFNYVNEFTIGFNGNVLDISKQTNGKYIVSGTFTQYNGSAALGICRLNADFSLDTSFTPPPLNASTVVPQVKHRLLSDDKIIVFGYGVKCSTSHNIGKLNINGTLDTTFKSLNGFFDGTLPINGYSLNDISIDDSDNIICVGNFLSYTWLDDTTPTLTSKNRIIRLTSQGRYDNVFDVGSGCSNAPLKVAYNPLSDTIVIAGSGTYKGDGISGIMEIDNVGVRTGKYYSLTGSGGNIVTAMHINASGILTLSGYFNSYSGTAVPNVIRILNNSSRDTTLPNGTALNTPAKVITRDATYTYLGGDFTVYSGQSILKYVKITSGGTATITNQYDFNERVNGIFLDGANTLVGGNFSIYENTIVPNNATIIPIGADSVDTQANTLGNIDYFNSYSAITYTVVNNNILVDYTYDNGDIIGILNAFDVSNYLELTINGEQLLPTITFSNYPQVLTPVYNPVTFKFDSPSVDKAGFRYLFNVYNGKDNSLIANFKLSPQIDGTGYLDVSKILSNLVSVDYSTNLVTYDANKSYVDYYVQTGAEFNQSWNFDNIYANVNFPFNNNIILSNSILLPHSYVNGDQIIISSSLSGNAINGLHQIVEVINAYNVIIDTPFIAGTSASTFGTTSFADNTKLSYPNLATITGLTAFNGARSWAELVNWDADNYTMASTASTANFLTDIPSTGFNITPTQDIFLNIHCDISQSIYPLILVAETNNNITSFIDEITLAEATPSIQQIAVGFNQISEIFSDCYPNTDCIDYYDVYLLIDGDPGLRVSEKIRFNIDRRCKIEDYEILFMDRMGSLASYAFQLRASEKGTIKRDMFKQQVDYDLTPTSYLNSYDISERGSTITSVNVTKTLELNSNWMTDEMSVYFEQLLSSPYTWIKIDNKYYACTINDSDFEIVRQKNKNLIRKTVTITMANNNTINI